MARRQPSSDVHRYRRWQPDAGNETVCQYPVGRAVIKLRQDVPRETPCASTAGPILRPIVCALGKPVIADQWH